MQRIVRVVALVLASGWLQASQTSPQAPPVTRVLFIGNSLTAANNLPALVEALARSAGLGMACRAIAFPDYSLEDHWKRGEAGKAIAEGGWSIVVLQQGPSALPASRVHLAEYTRRFATEAQRVGARTALYMVWPSQARRADFDGVRLSYEGAAKAVSGIVLPVGEAWRAAWRRDGTLELYGSDGFHPTPLASYLAALVIYQQLSGRSPIGLPATVTSASSSSTGHAATLVRVPPERAALLQAAAVEANAHAGAQ